MIGVDIGGTNLLVGVIQDNNVVRRTHEPIRVTADFELVANQVCDAIQSITDEPVQDVGIAVAGSVDAKQGIVLRAQNLDWDNVPLAEVVATRLKCNVVIENDVTAAAWGEFRFGAGIDANSIFAVWIGTGIGGGLILNGAIWRGPFGTAGEFGMSISEHNTISKSRVLEAFASRRGLQEQLGLPTLDTATIAAAYPYDDMITKAIDDGAKRVGTSIANVITLLSLDTVVLGGGLVEALGDHFLEQIRAQFEHDVFPEVCSTCVLIPTILGPDAGLLGVADIASL